MPTRNGTALIQNDPHLEPYRNALIAREQRLQESLLAMKPTGGILGTISQGHHYYGFQPATQARRKGYWYREWAPGAKSLSLIGDFNGWNRSSHPLSRDAYGVWSAFVPKKEGLTHESRLKVHVVSDQGLHDRIPAYIRRAVQGTDEDFAGQLWDPPKPYVFKNSQPTLTGALRIYEAHVGMASEEPRVATFREFTRDILPRIASLGYNAVQLMAVMEHPYYGSFGYHVSSFYAVSSRFGTPEDLKELIDAAHGLGLNVLLDLVHSHAVRNTREGLNYFDGTDYQYFHSGPRGYHSAWDSMVFDYGKYEVLRFLLSNVRYWLEEYRFDGFRFDGVTSMLYRDHGLGKSFGGYDDYYGPNVDEDAVTYLKLTNKLAHEINPHAITIAEDMSGMPGTARPIEEGGLGFDYRLAMGVPDAWIKMVKEKPDEEWRLGEIYSTLLNRRRDEKHIGYAESHDQALVGDKTLAFRLMDREMYTSMSKQSQSPIVDRGIALHKLIRLITFSLAGEGWLSFMGNEFGHPEWIDFPREGNQFSYHYARRQWQLASREDLRFHGLQEFDRALQNLDRKYDLLKAHEIDRLLLHEDSKLLAFRRGPLVFAFNFHPSNSCPELRIPVPEPRDYRIVLDTDLPRFEGHGRVGENMVYPWQKFPMGSCEQSIQIYLPSRCAQVLHSNS